MWIINIVLVALGFIFLERKAILWSVFASFALSGYVSLFEMLFPGASTASITGDMWLDLCFAVILPAIGSAMVFDIGASTGGTDILAMILKRHSTLEIGRALLLVASCASRRCCTVHAWASTVYSACSPRRWWSIRPSRASI